VVSALGRATLVRKLPRIYRGAHLRDPAVRVHRGRVLEAEALGPRVPIELDGEPLGFLPARFEVLPGALSLVGPAA
jgi:diacylglycerol kinase family enzyme